MVDPTALAVSIFNGILSLFAYLGPLLKNFIGLLIGLSMPLALFFLIGIIYCVEGLKKIRIKEAEMYDLKVEPAYEDIGGGDAAMARGWEGVTTHMASDNENDWKQGIIDADILLDNLLSKMGYQGNSVGEKLKRVNPGDMKSLSHAWEAHKIRNAIAHQAGFKLDKHVAHEAYQNYKKVFEEFYYV